MLPGLSVHDQLDIRSNCNASVSVSPVDIPTPARAAQPDKGAPKGSYVDLALAQSSVSPDPRPCPWQVRTDFMYRQVKNRQLAVWPSGMIRASGARGPGFP